LKPERRDAPETLKDADVRMYRNKREKEHATMINFWNKYQGIIITLITLAALELLAHTSLRIPNPPPILMLAIILSTYMGGMKQGLISAAIVWCYSLSFFSISGRLFNYTDDNFHRIITLTFAIPATAILVGTLKRRADQLDGIARSKALLMDEMAERKKTEQGIVRLSRLYSVLGSISEAIIRIRKTDDLCKEICRIVVEQGLFRMAWIGFIDSETLQVKPAAICGHEDGYLKVKRISVDEHVPEGRGPTGTALRKGSFTICNDVENDPIMQPWKEEALKRGYRSHGAFALKKQGKAIGTFNVYSSETFYFQKEGEEIIQLLTRLADNISFALETIDNNALRKKAEEGLQKSEEFTRSILESVGEGFVVIDQEYRIISANRAYCEQTKLSCDDIVGRHCYEISHHIEKPCFTVGEVCAPMHTFKTGEPTLSVHTHYDAENNPVYIETRSFPMKDASGRITAIIETLNNITDQKKLADQLRHAQKMEAVGTLAGGVAHDFNNILSAIIGYAHISLMKMKPDDPVRHNIDQILASSQRAAALTQGLLSFSRKQVINPVLLDLNELVQRFEKFIIRLIREDIEFTCRCCAGALPVMADSGQIEQAIMNLVTNARDAMPEGGRLMIVTDRTRLGKDFVDAHGYGVPGEFALISITDTGLGMDETTKAHIFEPFFTTKEVGKGTGLGLSMVYGIVKKHDGFITVYSERGKGTTFKIYLPVSQVKAAPEKEHKEAPVPSLEGTETVLLAEDDEFVRRLTRTVLEKFGYTVIEAADGEDAVHKFIANKDRVQLAILDAIMPKKNGGEVFRELTAMKPGFPVLFMSGYPAEIVGKQGILEPGFKFVPKPISPSELLKKVRDMLGK